MVMAATAVPIGGAVQPQSGTLSTEDEQLRATVLRFFDGQSDYLNGDLIVRSQVTELQDYLRKTRGLCRATHPSLWKRVLADHASFCRMFFGPGGRKTLNKTAEILGGYSALARLCQSKQGRAVLAKSIQAGDAQMLVDYVRANLEANQNQREEPSTAGSVTAVAGKRFSKIYSVEDLLFAIFSENQPSG